MSGPSTATTSSSSALSTWLTTHRRAVLVAAASLTILTAGSLYYASSSSAQKTVRDAARDAKKEADKLTKDSKKSRKAKGAADKPSSSSSPTASSSSPDKTHETKPVDDDGASVFLSLLCFVPLLVSRTSHRPPLSPRLLPPFAMTLGRRNLGGMQRVRERLRKPYWLYEAVDKRAARSAPPPALPLAPRAGDPRPRRTLATLTTKREPSR